MKMKAKNKEANISKHYKKQRYKREKFINKYVNGDGKVIDSFIINRGHVNGIERHDITENGIILIYNNNSNILVSKLIARPSQIKRYYKATNKTPPSYLIYLAQWHEDLGYNK